MKYFLTLWLIVFSALCLIADYPRPPAGYAYETDLRQHSLVLTNAAAAGLANRSDIASATNALKSDMASALKPTAIYTPDGQTWTDATGYVWRVESVWRDRGRVYTWSAADDGWVSGDGQMIAYRPPMWQVPWYYEVREVLPPGSGADATRLVVFDGEFESEVVREAVTNLVTRVAYTNELANLTTTIPTIVTNTVRAVQGLVYDEKLGITWKQTMYDGNLYYVAVTNANITEVQ